jgi:nicotinate-nucleotide adenylyltransferase
MIHPEVAITDSLNRIDSRKHQYKALGRKTEVAILGGAFDPITVGHIETAKFVLNSLGVFDEVWLMPACHHMHGKKMLSFDARISMCRMAIEVDQRIKVSDYEQRIGGSGETYNLMKSLLDSDVVETHKFSMIIGMDNANSFDKWVNFKLLERMLRFVVVSREGIDPDPDIDWYLQPPHIYAKAEGLIPEVSSTQIRSALHPATYDLKVIESCLDPRVRAYIETNGLYERRHE